MENMKKETQNNTMTLEKLLLESCLVNDQTKIIIRSGLFTAIAQGEWFTDRILGYMDEPIDSFTWEDENKLYIDLKEEPEQEETPMFTDEELAKVETEEERQHLIECAADYSKIDERYMQIMNKYGLWEGEKQV